MKAFSLGKKGSFFLQGIPDVMLEAYVLCVCDYYRSRLCFPYKAEDLLKQAAVSLVLFSCLITAGCLIFGRLFWQHWI